MNFFGRLLVFLGIISLIIYSGLMWQRYNPNKLRFNKVEAFNTKPAGLNSEPVLLEINSQNVKLPIYYADISNGKWSASTSGVSFLSSSPIPGEIGNSIIYGHNWPGLLGKLINIKPGQTISVVFVNGEKKAFDVYFTQVVTPDDIGVLNQETNERILTIYTCTGFLDSKRFVAVAKYKQT